MHSGMDTSRAADDSTRRGSIGRDNGTSSAPSLRAVPFLRAVPSLRALPSLRAGAQSCGALSRGAVSRSSLIGAALACMALFATCGAPGSGSGAGGAQASGPSAEPRQLRVRWQVYSSAQDLALASQGLLDRAATYSQAVPLAAASTKIAPDEVVAALIEHCDSQGLRSQPGAAPAAGLGWSQSIEIEESGGKRWFGVGASSPLEEQKRFRECWQAFTAVYNQTYQLQAVEQTPDWQSQDAVLKRQQQRRKSP